MRIAFAVVAVISQICSAIATCDYQKLVSIRYQINRYLIHFEITTRRDECLNQLPFVSFPLFLHSLGNVLLFAEHVHIAKGKQLLRRVQRIQGMRHRRCQYGKACFLLC